MADSRRQTIINPQNHIYISIACLWEMAIKTSISKLIIARPLADVIKQITVENIEVLPISPVHTLQVSTLPFHHRDPFDRIIIAQARVENFPIMTDDGIFGSYGIQIL